MHDIGLIITTAAIIGNLTLGIIVLKHDPKNKINQIYFTFIAFLAIWMASSYAVDENIGELLQEISLRTAFVSGLVASYSLLQFSLNFSNKSSSKSNPLIQTLFKLSIAIFVLLCIFTNTVVVPVEAIQNAYFYQEGNLYPLYAVLIIVLLLYSVQIKVRNYNVANGRERLQLAYLIWGLTIPIFFISVFTLIAPILAPTTSEYEFSLRVPLHRTSLISISIYVLISAYAIIRHRLFGIRVILGEILFWLTGSALVFLFFYGTILIEQQFFDSLTNPFVIFLNMLIALIVFPTLRATNNWLRHAIRKITINVSFDREHILTEYNKEITQSHTTKDIIDSLFSLIHEAYSPKFIGVILIEQ